MNPIIRVFITAITTVFVFVMYGTLHNAQSRPMRMELASAFHPADPLFGSQLQALYEIVKDQGDRKKIKFRRSRKTRGASAKQMVDLLNTGSIDGVLLDPIRLGYRPAIAQVFGGLPFGPKANQIIDWSESQTGREHILKEFQGVGAHPLICGHSDIASGVFARNEFVWPAPSRRLLVHTRGLANSIYQNLKLPTRPLPGADLYLGYTTGVVDLVVSLNPSMDAKAGLGQVSSHFYYPSWERSSAFALLLMSQKKWQVLSNASQNIITNACKTLNGQSLSIDTAATIATIAKQGANDTIVKPWPPNFLNSAEQLWKQSAIKVVERHPSLAPAFEALNVPR